MNNSIKTHKCLASGCQQQISHSLLMCPYHWALVPVEIQQAVYKGYKAPGRQGWFDAANRAVTAVRKAEKDASQI